jgi:light-regulated signal transduction histidine kinase (bacteriophytochrome)
MLDATSLGDCEKEPLARLGLVQPHGGLLLLDPSCRQVLAASIGLGALLGGRADPRPGDRAAALLPKALRDRIGVLPPAGNPPHAIAAPALVGDAEVLAHRTAEGVLVEWVRPTERAPESVVMVAEAAGARLAEELRAAPPNVFAAAQRLADGVARLSGYDRVMVYRFHPDWSGEVIAERRRLELPPFLGLRYPASDIPPQARELYRHSMLRVVADVHDVAQPILHGDDRPPDLSLAVLRSVSPIHLQYLRNMGVRATLTISLVHEGRLWGLLACHHGRPRLPPAGVRSALVALGAPFASLLGRAEAAEAARAARAVAALRRAGEASGDGAGLLAWLMLSRDGLAGACGADGIAYVDATRVLAVGLAPDPATLRRLAGREREIQRLDLPVPPDARRVQPAGLLAATLPGGGWLGLFRRELTQEVHWAGNPAKAAERGPDGQLSPRRSFALWREEVRGACRPWGSDEQALLAAAVEMLAEAGPPSDLGARAVAAAVALAPSDADGPAAPELLPPQLPAVLLDGTGNQALLADVSPALAGLLGVGPAGLRGLPWREAAAALGLAPLADPQGGAGDPAVHAAFSPHHGPLHLRLGLETALQLQAPGRALHLDRLVAGDETREGRLAAALRAAGQQVERARQAREAFLAHASHELRTPLNAIIGLAELLEGEALPEPARQPAQEIGKAGRGMLTLVEMLLAVSRLEAGRFVAAREPFDLAELLRSQARLLAPLFDAKPVRLELDLPPSARCLGDAGLVAPVVLNLLANALKFTPPRGEVALALALAPGVAEIRVTDTGPGVPASARARIFEPFEQLDASVARTHGGAGLGLHIARSMVEALGGSLRFEPGPQGGSSFVVRLEAGA